MRATRSRNPEGIHEPNMVPLIDVSLVLVVILLVATPMMLQSGIAVSRAASSGASAQAARTERIEIEVVDAGHVRLNRALVARSELTKALGPMLAQSASRQVVVRCADEVAHGEFVEVLDDIKSGGAAHIAVVGR